MCVCLPSPGNGGCGRSNGCRAQGLKRTGISDRPSGNLCLSANLEHCITHHYTIISATRGSGMIGPLQILSSQSPAFGSQPPASSILHPQLVRLDTWVARNLRVALHGKGTRNQDVDSVVLPVRAHQSVEILINQTTRVPVGEKNLHLAPCCQLESENTGKGLAYFSHPAILKTCENTR